MYHDFNYEATLASSLRGQWQLDDVLRVDQDLDFSRNFMPQSLARTAVLDQLNPFEQRVLNQLFKSLMKHHWVEEAQHAKLDTLIVDALAEGRSEEQIDKAIDEFFEIGGFLDDGLKTQAGFNLEALETAIGRKVENRDDI